MKLSSKERAEILLEPGMFSLYYTGQIEDFTRGLRAVCTSPLVHGFEQVGKMSSLFCSVRTVFGKLVIDKGLPRDGNDAEAMEQINALYSDLLLGSMLYCWELNENAYLVDRDALTAILSAPLPAKFCLCQLLHRFREYSIYVSFDWEHGSCLRFCLDGVQKTVKGVFMQLDGDSAHEKEIHLRFVPVTEIGPERAVMTEMTFPADNIYCSIGEVLYPGKEASADIITDATGDDEEPDHLFFRSQTLKVLAYILSDNHDVRLNGSEINWSDRDSMRPKATKEKGAYKFLSFKKNNVYTVGGKLGKEIRARLSRGAAQSSIKGHFTAEAHPGRKVIEDTLSFTLDD